MHLEGHLPCRTQTQEGCGSWEPGTTHILLCQGHTVPTARAPHQQIQGVQGEMGFVVLTFLWVL